MEAKLRLGCWKDVRNTFARLSVNKHISSDTPSSLTRTAVGHITAVDEAPGVLSRRETTPSDLWVWLAGSSLGATCDPAYLHERRLFTFWTLCVFLGSVSSRCSCINHRRSAPAEQHRQRRFGSRLGTRADLGLATRTRESGSRLISREHSELQHRVCQQSRRWTDVFWPDKLCSWFTIRP